MGSWSSGLTGGGAGGAGGDGGDGSRVVLRSHAKLNLTLYVTGRRADGFHALDSLFSQVDLHDTLAFEPGAAGPAAVELACDEATVPVGRENLICRAGEGLAVLAGRGCRVRVELRKRIPMGGGLGGGSSNAAAALRGLARLWDVGDAEAVARVGAELGSDVSFFLRAAFARVRGRGELVEPVRAWPFHAVLICPPFGCSTPAVYRAFAGGARDALPGESERVGPERLWGADGRAVLPSAVAGGLVNMLERAACVVEPRLGELLGRLRALTGRPVHVSGSGSTCFVLADGRREAEQISEACGKALGPTVRRVVVCGAGDGCDGGETGGGGGG